VNRNERVLVIQSVNAKRAGVSSIAWLGLRSASSKTLLLLPTKKMKACSQMTRLQVNVKSLNSSKLLPALWAHMRTAGNNGDTTRGSPTGLTRPSEVVNGVMSGVVSTRRMLGGCFVHALRL